MPAPPRNRFAAKPQDQQHSEALYVRLKKQDKERIVEAAGDSGIAAWARGVLLSAVARKRVKAAVGLAEGFREDTTPRRPAGALRRRCTAEP